MDDNLKGLLAQKKAQLKAKQKRAEIQQYKDRLTKNIEDFSQKYRYADEAEEVKLGKFISKLDFAQPGQLSIQEVCPYPHENVYLCFLIGNRGTVSNLHIRKIMMTSCAIMMNGRFSALSAACG